MAKQPATRQQQAVSLALQGGGSHGAFTWGVLDRLLEEPWLQPRAFSGASAGAMNAVVAAHGLQRGGADTARQDLQDFWRQISERSCFNPYRLRLDLPGYGSFWPLAFWVETLGRLTSPYQTNLLDINPLREILLERVDFGRLRQASAPRLYLAATDVLNNRLKIFGNEGLSVESVLASAALPNLYKAVQIEERHYWDGGFLANPPLAPLTDAASPADLLLVQLNPTHRQSPPDTAAEIADRLNEVTFNASLINELRGLSERQSRGESLPRLHRIDSGRFFEPLGPESKMDTSWSFLTRLRDQGRQAAQTWLDGAADQIGQASGFDLAAWRASTAA